MAFHALMEFCVVCGMESNLIGRGGAGGWAAFGAVRGARRDVSRQPSSAVYIAPDNFKFYAEGSIRLCVLPLVQDGPVCLWESRSVPQNPLPCCHLTGR